MPTTQSITIGGAIHNLTAEQHLAIQTILDPRIPAMGSRYYFVSGTGLIGHRDWSNGTFDNKRLTMGNVFPDKTSATNARDRSLAMTRLIAKRDKLPVGSGTGKFYPYKGAGGWSPLYSGAANSSVFGFSSNSTCVEFIAGSQSDLNIVFG